MSTVQKKSRIHDHCVLVLNKNWQAISVISPASAFSHMATGNANALAIEVTESQTEGIIPTSWKQWLNLPIRPNDITIGTARGPIRAPTVIILSKYSKVPQFRPKFGLKALWLRDNGTCQYSGKRLNYSEASIDHIIPVSRGGETSWENCVLSERRLNSRKGARTPAEAGLKLKRQPFEPRPVPVTLTLRNTSGIPEWDFFLTHAQS